MYEVCQMCAFAQGKSESELELELWSLELIIFPCPLHLVQVKACVFFDKVKHVDVDAVHRRDVVVVARDLRRLAAHCSFWVQIRASVGVLVL